LRVKSYKFKTKDCLVNCAKIEGSSYNLPGGLIIKLQNSNDQIENIHFELENGAVSEILFIVFFISRFNSKGSGVVSVVKAVEPFQS
jgi:hypothetical protein